VPAPALQKSKSIPSKNFKNGTHNRHKNSWTETAKTTTGKGLTMTVDRRPACNSGFAKKRVQWLIEHSASHQILWCIDSLVLRNPLLRKAANRYAALYDAPSPLDKKL
jgi:hypothetical protein